jgi:hypothetical protein
MYEIRNVQVTRVFDDMAASYNTIVPIHTYFGNALVTAAGVAEGDRVLDVGTGQGAARARSRRSAHGGARAIPPDADIEYRRDDGPLWGSCDGREGTYGWDDVVFQVHFSSKRLSSEILARADDALSAKGLVASTTSW